MGRPKGSKNKKSSGDNELPSQQSLDRMSMDDLDPVEEEEVEVDPVEEDEMEDAEFLKRADGIVDADPEPEAEDADEEATEEAEDKEPEQNVAVTPGQDAVATVFVDPDGNDTPEAYTLTRLDSGIFRRSDAIGTERKKLVSHVKRRKKTDEEIDPTFEHQKLDGLTSQGLQLKIKRLTAKREVLKTEFAEKLKDVEAILNNNTFKTSHKFASDFLSHILHNHILKEDSDDIVEDKLMTDILSVCFESLIFLLRAPAERFQVQEELRAVVEEKAKRDVEDDLAKLEAKKEQIAKKHEKKRKANLALLDSQEFD